MALPRWYQRWFRYYPSPFRAEAERELVEMAEADWAKAEQRGGRLRLLLVCLRLLVDHGVTLIRAWTGAVTSQPAGPGLLDGVRQDFRYAWRGLSRTPGFFVVAVAIIGVGIGATTTIMSVGNGLILRGPAGISKPGEMITVHERARNGSSFHSFSYLDFVALRDAGGGTDLAAYNMFPASVVFGGDPEVSLGLGVSGGYFPVLGVVPHLGRLLGPSDDQGGGGARVVVLSYGAWQNRFAGDSTVIGRALSVNGETHTIVGVATKGFHGHIAAFDCEVWVPLALSVAAGQRSMLEDPSANWLEVIGRAPGLSRRQVEGRLSAVSTRTGRDRGLTWDRTVDVRRYTPVPAQVFLPLLGFLGLLLLLGGLVLLISSTNIAGVMIARGMARSRETAVRLAVGASRGRLIRHLMAENLLLFVVGGAGGTALAWGATGLIARLEMPFPIPINFDFSLDARVLGLSVLVSLAAGLGFGLIPALQSTRPGLIGGLKDDGTLGGSKKFRLRSVLVTAQVAASALLIVVAGLFAKALDRADRLDLGLDPDRVRVIQVQFSVLDYSEEQVSRFREALEGQLAALPGVRSVGAVDITPLSLGNQTSVVAVAGREPVEDVGFFGVDFARVSPGYFATLSVPIVRGRGFVDGDRAGAPGTIIINEVLAATLWPGQDPIGRVLGWGQIEGGPSVTVVGVAKTGKYRTLGEEPRAAVYLPAAQDAPDQLTFLIKTEQEDPGFAAAAREAVKRVDPNAPIATNVSYRDLIGLSLLPNRIAASLASAFGLVGLGLATMGLYGVLSYLIVRRRREIGIRLALGAEAGSVRRLVLGEGLRLTGIGLVIGVTGAVLLGRALRSFLFGLDSVDPLAVGAAAGILMVITTLACDIPARRAAATDPVEVLRDD